MNKKSFIICILIIAIAMLIVLYMFLKNDNVVISDNFIENNIDEFNNNTLNNDLNNDITENKVEGMSDIFIRINSKVLEVELEDNLATKELRDILKNRDVVIEAREYGGFEKVGNLGFTLSKEDTNITTSAGDIVLYQGNQISIFYNSNSWSYTKLGKIKDTSNEELKNILGDGDVTIVLTLTK